MTEKSGESDFNRWAARANARRFIAALAYRERFFLLLAGAAFIVCGTVYQDASIARWVGFILAAYAAVANDSIQTIGTFIASNRHQKWWILWIFMGGLFLATVTYSWIVHDGDVSYQRLASKGFDQTPQSFGYLQVAAPIFLLILTRMRMPVSTTFLLLTSFSTSASSVGKVLSKSLLGYVVAFGVAIIVWLVLSRVIERLCKGEAHPGWRVAQWVTSGSLWVVWLMQDAANIAVYLPRQLKLVEFIAFAGIIVLGLGFLFFMRGERIQQIVDEKSSVVDVRAATIIDLVYAVILYYFKILSQIPMSTTWVFLGLLAGREIGMRVRGTSGAGWRTTMHLVGKDVLFAGIGLVVSLILAASVNDAFRSALLEIVGL